MCDACDVPGHAANCQPQVEVSNVLDARAGSTPLTSLDLKAQNISVISKVSLFYTLLNLSSPPAHNCCIYPQPAAL
jgi:hypothetical protein